MSDQSMEQATLPTVAPAPAALPAPPPPTVNDAAMQSRLDAYLAQIEARNETIQRATLARAEAEFEQRIRALEQRGQIESFARRHTMTTADQPFAIPSTAEELTALLLETPATVRGKWQTLLTRIATAGPLTFDEIGSSGESGEAADRWSILVNAKVANGMKKVDAIRAAAKEQPDLYEAQSHAKRGGR